MAKIKILKSTPWAPDCRTTIYLQAGTEHEVPEGSGYHHEVVAAGFAEHVKEKPETKGKGASDENAAKENSDENKAITGSPENKETPPANTSRRRRGGK